MKLPLRLIAIILCLLAPVLSAESTTPERLVAAKLLSAYVFVHGGSGVVVSPDGLVVTNHHVIAMEDRRHLEVRFGTGETHPARLLGTDPVGDISVLRIMRRVEERLEPAPGPFPWVELAPAEVLRPGIPVYAVGNPFALGNTDSTPTLTRGVLSTGRVVRNDYTDAIQVDAPVNPGNSGGPTFDEDGRLLGINGQIRTISGMRINSGVGLAIACTQLREFIPVLAAADGGYAHHTAIPTGLELVQRDDGVDVGKVPEGCPLQPGDRLLRIADREAPTTATVTGLFESLVWREGRTIPIDLRRDGADLRVEVPAARTTIPGQAWHGLTVSQMPDGLHIDHVDAGSPAEEAGITVGDLLVKAEDRELKRKVDLLKVLVHREIGDQVRFSIRAPDGTIHEVKVLLRQAE